MESVESIVSEVWVVLDERTERLIRVEWLDRVAGGVPTAKRNNFVFIVSLLIVVGWCASEVRAQGLPDSPQQPPAAPALLQKEAAKNVAEPCIQPAPMVRLEDYNGPLKKVVGTFARPLERKAVHPPHYKPGVKMCTLKFKDKFALFVQDSFDPVTFLATGFNAGLDQAENIDRSYGQGG
jgi:hypothetical protein